MKFLFFRVAHVCIIHLKEDNVKQEKMLSIYFYTSTMTYCYNINYGSLNMSFARVKFDLNKTHFMYMYELELNKIND